MTPARVGDGVEVAETVAPAQELKSETRKPACRIAEASDMTVAIGEQAFWLRQRDHDHEPDGGRRAGIGAFLEKRPPCWVGR